MNRTFHQLHLINSQPPSWLKPWLSQDFFLTKQLKKITGDARLEHIKTQWSPPDEWEKHVLQIQSDTVYRREIAIHSNAYPCWYAKTIIPEETYHNGLAIFERLLHESLGDIIFSDADVKRKCHEYYPISNECLEYSWPPVRYRLQSPLLWLKLSSFCIFGKFDFYLMELFLPGFEQCLLKNSTTIGS